MKTMNINDIKEFLLKHPIAYIELDNDGYHIYTHRGAWETDEDIESISADDIESDLCEGIYKIELMKALAQIGGLKVDIELC